MDEILKILKKLRPEFDFIKSNDFIADGLLDSFDIVMLVSELENGFGIAIDGLDIIPENFSSIEQIETLIKKSGEKK